MWNSTKIKREQRRLDDMVTNVGMPPSWEAIGRDKKRWVYRWRKGELLGEGTPMKALPLDDVFGGSWDD